MGPCLRFVFRHFPLAEIHPHAMHAVEAAEAAADQGKFWEMHDALFENQEALEDADLIRSGRTVFEHLWPRMPEGAKLFTHEASVDTFTRAVFDPVWWHKTLGECPPMLYGAGYGFGQHAVNLGWCQKR